MIFFPGPIKRIFGHLYSGADAASVIMSERCRCSPPIADQYPVMNLEGYQYASHKMELPPAHAADDSFFEFDSILPVEDAHGYPGTGSSLAW